LICLLVAACAPMAPEPDQPSAPEPAPSEPAPPPVRPDPGPEAPPPAAPDEAMSFAAWRDGFIARRAGTNRALWERELAGLSPDPRVIERDRSQPEFTRGAGDYISRAVSADRVA